MSVEVLKCFVNVCIVRLLCDNEKITISKKLERDQPMNGILNKQNQPIIVTVARPNDQWDCSHVFIVNFRMQDWEDESSLFECSREQRKVCEWAAVPGDMNNSVAVWQQRIQDYVW